MPEIYSLSLYHLDRRWSGSLGEFMESLCGHGSPWVSRHVKQSKLRQGAEVSGGREGPGAINLSHLEGSFAFQCCEYGFIPHGWCDLTQSTRCVEMSTPSGSRRAGPASFVWTADADQIRSHGQGSPFPHCHSPGPKAKKCLIFKFKIGSQMPNLNLAENIIHEMVVAFVFMSV